MVPEEELPPALPKVRVPEVLTRQLKIRRKVELERYGFTESCPGCIAAQEEREPRAHSAACRERIESRILQDDIERGERLRAIKTERGEELPSSQATGVPAS